MATAADVIKRSLRLLTVIQFEDDVPSDYVDLSIQAFNEMMDHWEADGLDLGWTTIFSTGDTVTVPADSLEGIAFNLALRLAPEFGVPLPEWLVSGASGLYTLLQRLSLNATAIPGTDTAADIIKRALRLSAAVSPADAASSHYLFSGLQALNDMVLSWVNDGISLGYSRLTSLSSNIGIPTDDLDVVAFNLACRLAAEYGKEPPSSVLQRAEFLYSLKLTEKISPASVAPTTTAAAAIDRAMRLCGIARNGDQNKGTYQLAGLKALNDMMARWEGNGLATSYASLTSAASAIGVAEKLVEPIVLNLAVDIAPEYNKQLPPEIIQRAGQAYLQALQDAANVSALPTTTKGIVQRALRLAGVPNAGQSLYLTSGLQALNELLHRWEANGVTSGFSGYTALTDSHNLPAELLRPITYNLAVDLAAENSVPLRPDVAQIAAEGYSDAMFDSKMVKTVYMIPYMSH